MDDLEIGSYYIYVDGSTNDPFVQLIMVGNDLIKQTTYKGNVKREKFESENSASYGVPVDE
jgi:hypothetical protein